MYFFFFLLFILFSIVFFFFFFFNDSASTEISTLSLHDALPISDPPVPLQNREVELLADFLFARVVGDRKSTRLNSSHMSISDAVFCLKKKKKKRREEKVKKKRKKGKWRVEEWEKR